MTTVNTLKVIGIVDGGVIAIITALGHYVQAYASACTFAAIVLGIAGTTLSSIATLLPTNTTQT